MPIQKILNLINNVSIRSDALLPDCFIHDPAISKVRGKNLDWKRLGTITQERIKSFFNQVNEIEGTEIKINIRKVAPYLFEIKKAG